MCGRLFPSPALQLPINRGPDHVQPGFPFLKTGVDPLHGLGIEREGKAFRPKFFASHGSFSYVRY
jgi:hypothetical protein